MKKTRCSIYLAVLCGIVFSLDAQDTSRPAATQVPSPIQQSASTATSQLHFVGCHGIFSGTTNSKTASAGQPIEIKITVPLPLKDGLLLPAGTILHGYIKTATARGVDSQDSILELQFDQALVKDKEPLPVVVYIRNIESITRIQQQNQRLNDGLRSVAPMGSSFGNAGGGLSGTGGLATTAALTHNKNGGDSRPVPPGAHLSMEPGLALGEISLGHTSAKLIGLQRDFKLDSGMEVALGVAAR